MSSTAEQKRAWYLANHERELAKRRAWYLANREKSIASSKEWYDTNKDAASARHRSYYAANRERIRARQAAHAATVSAEAVERVRQWRKANPEKYAATQNRRRFRETDDADLTGDQWASILAIFDGHCAYCGGDDQPLVMEHMTPLSRRGRHTAANVVPACARCNSRKHTKTADEFMEET
jgi:5-methylcytosine-specific restriction endonuclease McrA